MKETCTLYTHYTYHWYYICFCFAFGLLSRQSDIVNTPYTPKLKHIMSIGAYTPFFFVFFFSIDYDDDDDDVFVFQLFFFVIVAVQYNCLHKQCPEIDFYSEAITQKTHIRCIVYIWRWFEKWKQKNNNNNNNETMEELERRVVITPAQCIVRCSCRFGKVKVIAYNTESEPCECITVID